jgi:hypothetical protein
MDTKILPRETETRKAPSLCAGCGEPSGSISAGTGFPLVRGGRSQDGDLMYHVRCLPGTRTLDAVWSRCCSPP